MASIERTERQPNILLIKLNGAKIGEIRPTIIQEHEGEVSSFISAEIQKLKRREEKTQRRIQKFSRTKSHHRLRGFREISQVLSCLSDDLSKTKDALKVLEGKEMRPLRLIIKGGKIESYEYTEFDRAEEKNWWTFVFRRNLLVPVAEIAEKYPDSLQWFIEAFEIRSLMKKAGSSLEKEEVRKRFDDYRRRYREIPIEQADAMTSIMREISESV